MVSAPAEGEPTVVSVTPSGPVSATATTLTFTSCESSQSVTFNVASDAAPGDYPISVSASDADEPIGGDGTAVIRVPSRPRRPTRRRPS